MTFNQLKKNLKNDFTGMPVVRIAVLADAASQLFCIALKGHGITVGIHFDIWEADYNQIYMTTLEEESPLYINKPDFVIINQSSIKLLDTFYKKDLQQKRNFSNDQLAFANELYSNITRRINTNFIFLNFAEINDAVFGNFANKLDSSFLYQLRKLNVGIMDMAIEHKNVNICDLSTLQNTKGRLNTVSDKLYINTDNVLEIDSLPPLVKSVTDIVLAYQGQFKKCVILDLDNTTWGGIIGDDGMEGIQIGDLGIGKAFTNFQKWILQLKDRGIIVTVCSKNTEHIAKEPFEKHPEMVLKLNDIAVFVANWENKADNIRQIQSILNIGFDAMVFLDDNPAERAIIKQELPAVTVPDLPEDPTEYLSFLYSQNLFETASFTEADGKRNDQYREEAGRAILSKSFTDEAGFLKSLDMRATSSAVNDYTLPRAAQLTQRSNQFNLRTIRYTDLQLKQIIQNADKATMALTLQDKFGDYGLIALLILEKQAHKVLFIDTWIMSCRVLKRNVENFTLNQLVLLATKLGCVTIKGQYLPTSKNGIVALHYKDLGFTEDHSGFWQLDVSSYIERQNYITLQ